MRYPITYLLLFFASSCVPTLPGDTNNTTNSNNNNGSNGTPTATGCGASYSGGSNGGSSGSSGPSGPTILLLYGSPIPFCTYQNQNSIFAVGITYISLPSSTDTLFIWEDPALSADFVSSASNGSITSTGDVIQFLADSVTGRDVAANATSYYLVRRETAGYTPSANDKNFLAPASKLCLNFDLYGNSFNQFPNGNTEYIAFRISAANGSGYNYGWIKLVINNFQLFVYDIGIDENLNEPIAMGQQ